MKTRVQKQKEAIERRMKNIEAYRNSILGITGISNPRFLGDAIKIAEQDIENTKRNIEQGR